MNRYTFRRVTPQEFRALLKAAKMDLGDFTYITGRQRLQVNAFLDGLIERWQPTMADVMLLELAADEPTLEDMFAISDRYLDHATEQQKERARKWRTIKSSS